MPEAVVVPATVTAGIDPVTITLVGGMIVTVIGAIATAVISIITALRVSAVSTQQAASVVRVDAIAKDTEAIKGHVNSEKTAAMGREEQLRMENGLLREMLADKKATAGLLAQAVASRGTRGRDSDVQGASPTAAATAESLASIDDKTAAIKEDTAVIKETAARTDAAVQDMKK